MTPPSDTRAASAKPQPPVRGLANKAPEHAARLAATFEGFKNPDANEISKSLFDTATELVDFYLNEALWIYTTI